MKNFFKLYLILIIVYFLALASAQISVDKVEKASVIISELESPAVFDLLINNSGSEEEIEIYTLLGVSINPKQPFKLPSGSSIVEIKVYPTEEMRKQAGFISFEYQIKGDKSGIFRDKLRVKIVPLKEALSISSGNLGPDDSSLRMSVKNLQSAYLDSISINFKSLFFDRTENVSLSPFQTINISIPAGLNNAKTFKAGPYLYKAKVNYQGAKENFDGAFNYLEKQNVSASTSSKGFIIRKNTIIKKNEGNVPIKATIEKKQDIISRLFTVHSVEPMKTERRGLLIYYTWEKELEPTSSFTVITTTNYTMPFILVLLIILIAVFVSISLRTHVSLNKRVSFVRTKGGEFALKVRIYIKSRKYVENIKVTDKLPGMAVLYEKFGIRPDIIDLSRRQLIWKIPRLNAGEERVFSYIIYSKLKIVGRFELPSTRVVFEKDGKTHEASSNRTFFIADTSSHHE